MTPKEKAQELYNTYEQLGRDFTRGVSMNEFAIECALIAVDEIIKSNPHSNPMNTYGFSTMAYWQEVKHEIEKL
jgi:hypothetical protein